MIKKVAKKAARKVAVAGAKLAVKTGSKVGEMAVKGVMSRRVQKHRARKVLHKVREKI